MDKISEIKIYDKSVMVEAARRDSKGRVIDKTYATKLDVADIEDVVENKKQDKLVSGNNIKTINGQSILGSGDLTLLPLTATFEFNPETGELEMETRPDVDRIHFSIADDKYLEVTIDG